MLLLILAAAASAPPSIEEDAAHRADRLRTIELNRRARAVIDRRDGDNAAVRRAGRKAQDDYERRRAEWQARVQACLAGEHSACDH